LNRNRALKECVAAVYKTDTFNSLLKNTLHPGGLQLTRRVAEIAQLHTTSRVLDIACGKGGAPWFLAQEYGCQVIGIDLSDKMIALARSRSKVERLNEKVKFIVADAEELPFRDTTFDAIISESSFSILPNKVKAASEMERVLRSNGRLLITDVISRRTASEIQSGLTLPHRVSFPLIPCIAGARSIEDYLAIFEHAGFRNPYIEDHSVELKKLAYQMGIGFGSWGEFLQKLSSELSSASDSKESERLTNSIETYQWLLAQGQFGYALIVASKP